MLLFLKALAASSFLTSFIRFVLQLKKKYKKASAKREVLKSKAFKCCTLVLKHCCVLAF
jgi:hypothetical protein